MGGKARSIFEKRRLTPSQLRTVAERRFDDAICLLNSGDRVRANGAMYIGGFVIECLLKALLLDRHPNLQKAVDPAKLSSADRKIFALLYGHELDEMLDALPNVERKLNKLTDPAGSLLLYRLRAVCEQWTVYARYSTRIEEIAIAKRFVETIREVKQWLKEL